MKKTKLIHEKEEKYIIDENIENNKLITEWKEEDILDASLIKSFKYIISIIVILFILFSIIYYSVFNISNNNIWVTEWFFTKKIEVYSKSGIKFLNPFGFNKKTTYPNYIQNISFSDTWKWENKNSNNKNINIYDEEYKYWSLRVNTKDGISVNVLLSVSYRIKTDSQSVIYVYNNTWNWNFVDKIVKPTITSSISDVYSKYTLMDIVNKTKAKGEVLAISSILEEKIKTELANKWFELENFTFSWINKSAEITKTIEELFNTQNQLELEKTKFNTLELKNKNALKELELTTKIAQNIKQNNISIWEYQKIKMLQIFQDKWNWNTIPNNLNKLLQ